LTVRLPFPAPTPQAVVAAIAAALTPATRLAVVDHLSSETALLLPIREIAALCRSRGVALLADGAHAPGALESLDIPAIGADYYVANLHKWAFAPRSSGILWAAPERQAAPSGGDFLGPRPGLHHRPDLPGTRDATAHLCAPMAIALWREWAAIRPAHSPSRPRSVRGALGDPSTLQEMLGPIHVALPESAG
jgi:isopenicillin-N epimerase